MERRIQYWLTVLFLVILISGCGQTTDPTPSPNSYTISGKVTDSSSLGISGVSMTLTTSGGSQVATTTTDSNGQYSFSVSNTGGYVITPSKMGYTFTSPTLSLTLSNADLTGQNFTGSLVSSTTTSYSATPKHSLPIALFQLATVYVPSANKIYALGGTINLGTFSDKIYAYDIATDTWSQATGTLPYNICDTSSALGSNGKIYLAPGIGPTQNNGWGTHSKLIQYDPASGASAEVADFGFAVWNSTLVAYQNDIYIFGGWTGSGVNKIWKFTPATGTLTLLSATLPMPANGIAAMLGTDDKIYLFNGYSSGYVQIFDPSNNSVSLSAAFGSVFFNEPVWRDSNNNFYIGTSSEIYRYSPVAGTLQNASLNLSSTLMNQMTYASSVTLPDGRVFIIGGSNNLTPSAGVWELAGNTSNSYTISGKVANTSGVGITGVGMTLTTFGGSLVSSATTSTDGLYSFTVANTGRYVITPAKTSYTFTPTNIAVNVTANTPGQNFTGNPTGTAGLMGGSIQGVPLTLANAVTTLAGSAGLPGSTDGTGTAVRFATGGPQALTTDGTNIFVADTNNHTIRKIVISTGAVNTLAGSPSINGSADGTGAAAGFSMPTGITTDGTNLYVSDYYNCTIRKIVIATGAVSTLAGSAGLSGSADGVGFAARFSGPRGITTDGTNLYVADTLNQIIRKIVIATGAVTTIAGSAGVNSSVDGPGTSSRFGNPTSITTDGANLYIGEGNDPTGDIRKIVIATNVVTTLAGVAGTSGSADGIGSAARFTRPNGITTDGTYLYVVDGLNNTIRKIDLATAEVTTIAGSVGVSGSTDGTGTAARFNQPWSMTNDATSLFVGDSYSQTIRRIQ